MSEEPTPILLADEDHYGAAAQRMVRQQLEARDIADKRLLEAMRRVPRHRFVDPSQRHRAYEDGALPVGHGQTISQPYMVARMTVELGVEPDDRVLEIGTGSGYQAAVLALLAREVVTVEREPEQAEGARQALQQLGLHNVRVHTGDGSLGWPEGAPYEGILVTAGAPEAPAALLDQLADPGRLVIPIGDRTEEELTTIERRNGELHTRRTIPCRFVPLRGEQGWRGE